MRPPTPDLQRLPDQAKLEQRGDGMVGNAMRKGRGAWPKLGLALVGALAVLAGCAFYERFDNAPLTEPGRTDVLAPYEAAAWPRYLHRINLPRDRDYLVVAFIPTNQPLDLGTPGRARRSLIKAVANPGFDTKIGHMIIAWQCGDNRGMTSMSGAGSGEAGQMFSQGWGFVAALSIYSDGHLYPEGEHRRANLEAIEAGRAIVTAAEVSRDDCEGMRAALKRFVTHPSRPATKYGLRLAPERFEGGGCISFGFYLANAAGVLRGVSPHIRRNVSLFATMLGRGPSEFAGVRLYRPPAGCCDRPIPIHELLLADWAQGPVVDTVRVEDGELVIAALVAAREGVASGDDWRFGRVLPAARDPYIARAAEAGRAFAGQYPVRRIADPGGVAALVLEQG